MPADLRLQVILNMTAVYLQILLTYLLLAGPGSLRSVAFGGPGPLFARILAGSLLSMACLMIVGYYIGVINLELILGYLVIGYSLSFGVLVFNQRNRSQPSERIHPSPIHGGAGGAATYRRVTLGIIVLLGVVAVSRTIPLYFSRLPIGWDPSFHLILVQKIILEGVVPVDWRPFEPVTLNYPLGSHILIAMGALLSGQPAESVFMVAFPLMATLTTAVVYFLGRSLSGDARLGLAAAFCYGLLAKYGSLDYYRWGGLPNMIGMLYFIASIWVLAWLTYPVNIVVASIFLAAVYLVHHHSMVSVLLALVAIVATIWLSARGDQHTRRDAYSAKTWR